MTRFPDTYQRKTTIWLQNCFKGQQTPMTYLLIFILCYSPFNICLEFINYSIDHNMLIWSHHFENFTVATVTWSIVTEYLCHKWPRIYVPFIVIYHIPYSWFISSFVTRVTRQVPLLKQELLTLPEYPISLRCLWFSCCSVYSFLCSVL